MWLVRQEVALVLRERVTFDCQLSILEKMLKKLCIGSSNPNAHFMVSFSSESAIYLGSLIMLDSANQTDGDTAVIDREVQRARKLSPKYKVLLHNDPVNTMDYVVETLRQVVPQLSEQDALNIMLETHNTGIGLVITCDLEPAEFYSESLKAKGLTSTIEVES